MSKGYFKYEIKALERIIKRIQPLGIDVNGLAHTINILNHVSTDFNSIDECETVEMEKLESSQ